MVNLNASIDEVIFTFVDVETTGLKPQEGEYICEIAIIKARDNKQLDQFYTLIKPPKPISPEAYLVNRISPQELASAPQFSKIAPKIREMLAETVICGYNVGFDLFFINTELERNNFSSINSPAIDILTMARENVTSERYRLKDMVNFFKIPLAANLHRALEDTIITAKVFFQLKDILYRKGIKNLVQLINLYGYKAT